MKRLSLLCFLSFSIVAVFSQESFMISRPDLQFMDNILVIRYDITGCRSDAAVNISLVISDSRGGSIVPVSVSGDVGKNISCGTGKIIRWDVVADKININDDLVIQVRGEKPAVPAATLQSPQKKTGRGSVIFSSVFVPGLGQKKASGKPAHLIFSPLVYGAGAASLYFGLNSIKTKDDYLAATGSEREKIYSDWENTYNMARYFAIGAAGAWAVNLIWSAAIPIRNDRTGKMKVSVIPAQDNTLLISGKLTF
jgi:hypothetical protein